MKLCLLCMGGGMKVFSPFIIQLIIVQTGRRLGTDKRKHSSPDVELVHGMF